MLDELADRLEATEQPAEQINLLRQIVASAEVLERKMAEHRLRAADELGRILNGEHLGPGAYARAVMSKDLMDELSEKVRSILDSI
jgi:hypothetical protein